MIIRLLSTRSRAARYASARWAIAGMAAALSLVVAADLASARSMKRDEGRSSREEYMQSRPAGRPVMAVVSLRQQRVTVYDGEGWIMRARVSSGRTGYETPAGIYSVLQRKEEHYSNLYDDAAMPFMQRLTWSGIALHAGALPGYPASHGCVRMPASFAERLYEVSRLGMRVIVMPDDVAPAPFSHPKLFKPWSEENARTALGPRIVANDAEPQNLAPFRDLRRIAVEKAAKAEEAATKLDEARRAAVAKNKEAAIANRTLRVAQSAKLRAEAHVKRLERQEVPADNADAVAAAESAKAAAAEALAQAEANLEAVRLQVQPVIDAVQELRTAAVEAQNAKTTAEEEAREARRKIAPIAVFISRATQRLYVRQGFQPLFESEVRIADADKPLGTYILSALAFENGEKDLRWNAVSMYGGGPGAERRSVAHKTKDVVSGPEPLRPDLTGARTALERITIPDEALERISGVISPGSSLIISDEPPSRETGPATEFIVVMSGEPQGGIKIRKPQAERRGRYERLIRRSPYSGSGWGSFW